MATKHTHTATKTSETAPPGGPGPWMPQMDTQPDFNPFANIESAARSPGATLLAGANRPTIRQPAVDTAPLQGMRDLSDPNSLTDVIAAITSGVTPAPATTANLRTIINLLAADGQPRKLGANGGVRPLARGSSGRGECYVSSAVEELSAPLLCFAAAGGEVSVDAAVLAEALELAPAELLQRIRARQISAVHEHGVGDDAGRERLIFYHRNRRVRLLIDAQGVILESMVERVHRPMPRSRAYGTRPEDRAAHSAGTASAGVEAIP